MRFRATIIFLLLSAGMLTAQDGSPRYRLVPGDQYFLEQSLSQTTRTEDGNLVGSVSLDIKNTLELEVVSVTAAGNYLLNCRYTSLELDFFAPQADIAISSSNSAFGPIKTYLSRLEGSSFSVLMSAFGAFLEVRGLDSIISNLAPLNTGETMNPGKDTSSNKGHSSGMQKLNLKKKEVEWKDVTGKDMNKEADRKELNGSGLKKDADSEEVTGKDIYQGDKQHEDRESEDWKSEDREKEDLIKKTIHDAFGAAALRSTANIALHFYDDTSTSRCVKETEVLFNGRPVSITNSLYFRNLEDHLRRVQGFGVIAESTTTIELSEYLLVTSLKGNQTYDFLCDLPAGWIREGMSKQKIHSLSGIRNHDELPEGLKIPSITESEYSFRGGKLNQ